MGEGGTEDADLGGGEAEEDRAGAFDEGGGEVEGGGEGGGGHDGGEGVG